MAAGGRKHPVMASHFHRTRSILSSPSPRKADRPLRVALFSGNYDCVRDGANQALNKLVHHLESKHRATVRVYSPRARIPLSRRKAIFARCARSACRDGPNIGSPWGCPVRRVPISTVFRPTSSICPRPTGWGGRHWAMPAAWASPPSPACTPASKPMPIITDCPFCALSSNAISTVSMAGATASSPRRAPSPKIWRGSMARIASASGAGAWIARASIPPCGPTHGAQPWI